MKEPYLDITDLPEAEAWINVHHRWLVRDIHQINRLMDRIAWLERPWYKRLFRKRPC